LFIGRENRDLDGTMFSHIESLLDAYHSGIVGGRRLNQIKTHYLQFYIAYGLNNGFPEYCDVPYAEEIAPTFAKEGGLSWAWMNLSKFSNSGKSEVADYNLIDDFCRKTESTGRNFWADEISIIDPDIIIGMNHGSYYDYIGDRGSEIPIKKYGNNCVDYYRIQIKGKSYPLLDCYHFSARKRNKECFYDPIVEAYKEILMS